MNFKKNSNFFKSLILGRAVFKEGKYQRFIFGIMDSNHDMIK